MTASPSGSASSAATSNPRSPSVSAISCADAGTSTNSRNHETTSRISEQLEQMQPRSHEATKKNKVAFVLVGKLFQEPQIVFVEQPNVLNSVAQDRDALDADAPREPGVALRIVSHRLEDGWMHHSRSADFEPSALLAHRAAGAVALPATDVDFGARLGVGEEARSEAHARALPEHVARERE